MLFTDALSQEATHAAIREIISSLENDSLLWAGQSLELVASRITTSNNLKDTLDGSTYVQVCVCLPIHLLSSQDSINEQIVIVFIGRIQRMWCTQCYPQT